jgi:hypothetical protein
MPGMYSRNTARTQERTAMEESGHLRHHVIDRMYGKAYSNVNLQTSGKAQKISAREYPMKYYEIYTSKGFPAVEGFRKSERENCMFILIQRYDDSDE